MIRRHWIVTTAIIAAGVIGFQVGNRGPESVLPVPAERPLIGIASVDGENVVRAVRAAGGIPVILPRSSGPEAIDGYLEKLDGLLMPGGLDIPPTEYGEEVHPTVQPLADDRYRFEKALGTAWIEQSDKPLLGICLGSQWINVLHGGTLVQDIPSELGGNHRGTEHAVTLEAGSRLALIMGGTEFEVNSRHHQAVGDLGKSLRIVARSADGVVEATETTDADRFLIGVQWHPEGMVPEDERQAKLFKAFVEAARGAKVE
jgi:putative glutamine amidotransferase